MKFETINGKLCLMTEQPCPHCSRPEIIATPVAEGSKEWALYRLMQGLKVCNPQLAKAKAARLGCDGETFNTYWYIVGDAVVEGESDYGTLSVSSWIAAASSTGWQLYKEPKPDYVAGDWVTDGVVHGRVVTRTSDTTWVEVQDGKQYHIKTSQLRKLDPTEVKVKVTLEGTVSQTANDGSVFLLWTGTDPYKHASIVCFADIDPETAKKVRELLGAIDRLKAAHEAQEEK